MLKKNKLVNVILAFVLSAAVAVSFTGCGSNDSSTSSASSSAITKSSSSEESSAQESSEVSEESSSETSSESSAEAESGKNASAYAEGTTVGEGENQFALEVILEDGSTTLFHVITDETTVGAALLDLIQGRSWEGRLCFLPAWITPFPSHIPHPPTQGTELWDHGQSCLRVGRGN